MAAISVLSSLNGLKLPLSETPSEFPKIYAAESAAADDAVTPNVAGAPQKSREKKSLLKIFCEGKRISDLPRFSDGKFLFSESALNAIKAAASQSTAKKNKVGKRYETIDDFAQEKKTRAPMSRKKFRLNLICTF